MSRTYRFNKGKDSYLVDKSWILKDYVSDDAFGWRKSRKNFTDPKSVEGKVRLARFHSDMKYGVMIGNGPSWFNRLFAQKPHRQNARRELHKFNRNPDHEVIICKPSQIYWW
jgi:hypothetical protein